MPAPARNHYRPLRLLINMSPSRLTWALLSHHVYNVLTCVHRMDDDGFQDTDEEEKKRAWAIEERSSTNSASLAWPHFFPQKAISIEMALLMMKVNRNAYDFYRIQRGGQRHLALAVALVLWRVATSPLPQCPLRSRKVQKPFKLYE